MEAEWIGRPALWVSRTDHAAIATQMDAKEDVQKELNSVGKSSQRKCGGGNKSESIYLFPNILRSFYIWSDIICTKKQHSNSFRKTASNTKKQHSNYFGLWFNRVHSTCARIFGHLCVLLAVVYTKYFLISDSNSFDPL